MATQFYLTPAQQERFDSVIASVRQDAAEDERVPIGGISDKRAALIIDDVIGYRCSPGGLATDTEDVDRCRFLQLAYSADPTGQAITECAPKAINALSVDRALTTCVYPGAQLKRLRARLFAPSLSKDWDPADPDRVRTFQFYVVERLLETCVQDDADALGACAINKVSILADLNLDDADDFAACAEEKSYYRLISCVIEKDEALFYRRMALRAYLGE